MTVDDRSADMTLRVNAEGFRVVEGAVLSHLDGLERSDPKVCESWRNGETHHGHNAYVKKKKMKRK